VSTEPRPVARPVGSLPTLLAGAVAAAVLAVGGYVARREAPRRAPLPAPASGPEVKSDLSFDLVDETIKAGLVFKHEKLTVPDVIKNVGPWIASASVGVAVADVNGDGLPDVYVTNMAVGSRNALFLNKGDGTFVEAGDGSGIADVNERGSSFRPLFFDFDGDGRPDLFLTTDKCPKVFHNEGGGVFKDISAESKFTGCSPGWAANAIDLDGDGVMDVVVAGYFPPVDFQDPKTMYFMQDSLTDADNGGPLVAYRNDGHGHFTPFPGNLGLKSRGWVHAVGVWDIDGDGRPDLYLATDYGDDQLYINKGRGVFVDESAKLLNKYSRTGMNDDFAQLAGDAGPSVYVTHIYEPPYKLGGNTLWTWDARGRVRERAADLGAGECGWAWGAKFVDLDLDGREDLVVTNGYISANPDKSYWYRMSVLAEASRRMISDARTWPPMEDASMSGYQTKCVFHNEGGHFRLVTEETGMRGDVSDGRALALIDVMGDGRSSVIEANQGQALRFYRNLPRGGAQPHWLGLSLSATRTSREAWGARVTVRTPRGARVRELEPADGFVSQSDPRLVFGLGADPRVSSVTVRWPSGQVQELGALAPDRYHAVVEPR
ncbi:MAG: CRTAC1 family protein, partial [Elusimicrobia bacterium]|nr:CRTAC1 family protein [Elusimicrobiota bacterium]